jgi:hypothetical protein
VTGDNQTETHSEKDREREREKERDLNLWKNIQRKQTLGYYSRK